MRYNLCVLVLLSFVLSGCEKEINLEHMRPNPKLVLNCLAGKAIHFLWNFRELGFMQITKFRIFLSPMRM